ncbi:MAG: DUF7601 domain-containing protein [Atopobiaceae bacterium]
MPKRTHRHPIARSVISTVTACALMVSGIPQDALAGLAGGSAAQARTSAQTQEVQSAAQDSFNADAISISNSTAQGDKNNGDSSSTADETGAASTENARSEVASSAGASSAAADRQRNASDTGTANSSAIATASDAGDPYIGVEDNDNDKADVRDESAGAADELDVTAQTVSDLTSFLAQLRQTPASTSDNPQGDGTTIQSLNVKWLTADTADNGDDSSLVLAPTTTDAQQVQAQIDFTLSGEHDYDVGSIRVRIPAHIFFGRQGQALGNVALPLAESPSTRTDFNWSYIEAGENGKDSYYILTNTRQLKAATTASIQLAYENVNPLDVVDGQTSEVLQPTIEVTTYKGNTLTRTASQELTAAIDTQETVSSARATADQYHIYTAAQMTEHGWTIPDGMESEDGRYLVTYWYTRATHNGNTPYTLTYENTPSTTATLDDNSTIDVKSFALQDASGTERENSWVEDGTTKFVYPRVAYPLSQFKADTNYKLSLTSTWSLTQIDDSQKDHVSTAENAATMNVVYHTPTETSNDGSFSFLKWGDDNDEAMTSHSDYTTYVLTGTSGGANWYGYYGDALNKLTNSKNPELSYQQSLTGYALQWLKKDNAAGTQVSDFGARNITITLKSGKLAASDAPKATSTELQPGTDYTYSGLQLIRPTIYQAIQYDASNDDQTTVVKDTNGNSIYIGSGGYAYGGTYGMGYSVDLDSSHVPAYVVTAYDAQGAVLDTQNVSWSEGEKIKSVELPDGTCNYSVSLTFGKAAADGTYVAGIRDGYVMPKVTLKSSSTTLTTLASSLMNSGVTTPLAYVTSNSTVSVASEGGADVRSVDISGTDRLTGYSADIEVIPSKSSTYKVDNTNKMTTITYTASVEERSRITSASTWQSAVANGGIAADTSGTWYDLLPRGVVPNLSTIKLRDGDRVTDSYTIANYKNTGRTLLVVKADLAPTPVSYQRDNAATAYYADKPTITFDATYTFDQMRYTGEEVHNVIAYESDNETLGNVEGAQGEPDNPRAGENTLSSQAFLAGAEGNAERDAMTDLDSTTDKPAFAYAGTTTTIEGALKSTVGGLSIDAMANDSGVWGRGTSEEAAETSQTSAIDAFVGGGYQYRLAAFAVGENNLSDLVFYDVLESFDTEDKVDAGDTTWKGKLLSVDVSNLKNAGVDAKVYYYTGDAITKPDDITRADSSSSLSEVADFTKAGWTDQLPADTSTVKAIAIDASKKTDGSPYVLQSGDSLSAYVKMLAPSGEKGLGYVAPSKGGTSSDADGAHAYNNAFLWSTSVSGDSNTPIASGLSRVDYTKVGLVPFNVSVKKTWDDSNDQDGKRADAVTVQLLKNGQLDRSVTLDGAADTQDSNAQDANYESDAWTALFKGLAYYDENYNVNRYSVREESVPSGYTASLQKESDTNYTITNTYVPETVSVSGIKTWSEDTEDVRPDSITVQLFRDGVYYRSQIVHADANDEWRYDFSDLPRYHDGGTPYAYTVKENTEDYQTAVNATTDDATGNVVANISNTYHPYGDLAISKTVTGATAATVGDKFQFTIRLTKADGSDFADQVAYTIVPTSDDAGSATSDGTASEPTSGTFTNGQTLELQDGQTLTLKNLPKGVQYTVIESAKAGYTTSSRTLSGTISSLVTSRADFTNNYATQGTANLKATKALDGASLKANQFRFLVKDQNGTVVSTATNEADGSINFGALRFTGADDGKTYTYTLLEENTGRAGYTYDSSSYTATVAPKDNGDGTMSCTVTYTDATGAAATTPSFQNDYATTGSVELVAYKKLVGGNIADYADQFTFQLYDAANNPLYLDSDGRATTTDTGTPLTATSDANGIVRFKLAFTQDDLMADDGSYADTKSLIFTAQELAGSDDNITYSGEKRSWRVTLSDNGDGTLSAATDNVSVAEDGTATHTDELPVFTNTMKPGSLSVEKHVDGESPDPNTEFEYTIKLTTPDGQKLPDTLNYELSAADSSADAAAAAATAAAEPAAAPATETQAASEADEDAGPFATISNTFFSAVKSVQNAFSGLLRASTQTDVVRTGTSPDEGTAYAVYNATDKSLTFIRSNETVTSGTDGTITDCEGNSYSGIIYTGFEEPNESWSTNSAPWYGYRTVITSVVFKDQIKPTALDFWFYQFTSCPTLTKPQNLITSDVTSMKFTFGAYDRSSASGFTSLDLSTWDTSNVKNLYYTFSYCTKLTDLKISTWNTSSVTDMTGTFVACTSLASVDVTDWNTENVTSMSYTFSNCENLANLDLSKWNTSNATNISGLVNGTALTSIDLSNFDTRNVTSMRQIFKNCSKLTSITFGSNWNTDKVNTMEDMFSGCSSLEALDLSNFKGDLLGTVVNSTPGVFDYTRSLKSIKIGHASFLQKITFNSVRRTSTYTGKWVLQGSDTSYYPNDIKTLATEHPDQVIGTWEWEKVSYAITFNKNATDASGSMMQQKFSGDPVTLLPNTFYRLGYNFTGWNTKADGTGTAYADGATISSITAPLTLYAQWAAIDTSVTPVDGTFTLKLKAGEKATFTNLPAGTTYQVVEAAKKGWTNTAASGTSGTIASNATKQASFTNAYGVTSVSATISATKTLDGATPADGAFTFCLTAEDNDAGVATPLPAGGTAGQGNSVTTTNAAGDVTFGPIVFAVAGEYHYTISEVDGNDSVINYDSHQEGATVHVTDDGEGTLSATVTYDTDGPNFSNSTKPGSLAISKVAQNTTAKEDGTSPEDGAAFTFTVGLTQNGSALDGNYTYTVQDSLGNAVTGAGGSVANGGTISIAAGQTATIANLPAGSSYTVSEATAGSGWSQTGATNATGTITANTTAEATFTNSYSATGTATVTGKKQLLVPGADGSWTPDSRWDEGVFQFALYAADKNGNATSDALETTWNTKPADDTHTANFTFDPLSYSLADLDGQSSKTFNYIIKEVVPDGAVNVADPQNPTADAMYAYDGILYSGATKKITVTVTDNGSGTLSTRVAYDDNTFVNYRQTGSVQISKIVDTASIAKPDQTFPFKVTFSGQTDLAYAVTYTNTETGEATGTGQGSVKSGDTISLGAGQTATISGVPVGTTYTFEEELPAGWTQVSATNMSGTIQPDSTTGASTTTPTAEVHNAYAASGTAELVATKQLKGGKLEDKQFSFIATQIAEDGTEAPLSEAYNDAQGRVAIGTITYALTDLEGAAHKTFHYRVQETIPEGATQVDDTHYDYNNVRYDAQVFDIFVDVSDKGDGSLEVTQTAELNGSPVDTATFTNALLFDLPSTGGMGTGKLVASGLAVMFVAGAVLYMRRRRTREA